VVLAAGERERLKHIGKRYEFNLKSEIASGGVMGSRRRS